MGSTYAKQFQDEKGPRGGFVVGTSGRKGTPQPANLPNGDPVFCVIAYNANTVQWQIGVSQKIELNIPGLRMPSGDAQREGNIQIILPVSYFIHETTENQKFQEIGASNDNYERAHRFAQGREGVIRRAVGITGGFAGAIVSSRVRPRR